MKRTLICSLIASVSLSLAWALPSLAPQGERQLKDSDLKKISAALADYIEARVERSGITDAEAEVRDQYLSINKKKLKKARVKDLLAYPADLGQALWLSGPFAKGKVRKGKVEERRYEERFFSKEDPLEYAVWTPSKYSSKTAYPLVLAIPDAGTDPKLHVIERWQAAEMKDNCVIAVPKMPGKIPDWTQQAGIARVLLLIKEVSDTHAIDSDRVYICGRGAGAAAALAIAEFFPDRFAGVIGRAGDVGETRPVNFRNLPTFFAGGGAKVTAFEKGIEEAGYGNCTVNAAGLETDIWNWIQANPRRSYPEEVTLSPGETFPTRSYWVQVQPVDAEEVRVDAKIDRDKNTITITGIGVTEAALYLNDALVDLSRPVVVIANGVESTAQIPRTLNTVLDLFFRGTIDPGRVYVATKTFHLKPIVEDVEDGEDE